jgi:Flp pilus assembly protein TadB
MSIITKKIQDLAEMMREMSDTLDAESAETPLLDTPHEAPPVWIINLVVEDESEKWQKRANDHINLLTHVIYSVAALAVLAALWVCLLAWSNIGGFLIYLGGIFVVSAVLSVIAQQRMKKDTSLHNDSKEAKKGLQDDNKCQLWALFLVFSAYSITLMLILYSIGFAYM